MPFFQLPNHRKTSRRFALRALEISPSTRRKSKRPSSGSINSQLTAGEDIADLGGLAIAWTAWREATRGQALSPRDGLTPEQRFFVGYAQWACENETDASKRLHALTDPHSPGKWRVNGPLANLPEFRQAFSCPVGTPMAPAKTCRIW